MLDSPEATVWMALSEDPEGPAVGADPEALGVSSGTIDWACQA